MNGCRSIVVIGPTRISKNDAELTADLLQRRSIVAAALTKFMRSGSRGLSMIEHEALLDAIQARHQQDLTSLPCGGANGKPALISETIRALNLADDQIPQLIADFREFWDAPFGVYVASRRTNIDGRDMQIVCLLCPPDESPDGTREFQLIDRVVASGLGAAAEIQ